MVSIGCRERNRYLKSIFTVSLPETAFVCKLQENLWGVAGLLIAINQWSDFQIFTYSI